MHQHTKKSKACYHQWVKYDDRNKAKKPASFPASRFKPKTDCNMIRSDALPTELQGTFLHVKLQISSLETNVLFHRTKIISFVIDLQLTQSVRKTSFHLDLLFLSTISFPLLIIITVIFCSHISSQFDVLSKTKI